jgi:hypothetical protein
MATVSLSDLWKAARPVLLTACASSADQELARQAFYAGAVSMLGTLGEAYREGDIDRVRRVLDRVAAEMRTDTVSQHPEH